MSLEGVEAATGRPSYHPSVLLKLYIYGYLNRVQSSRRLEREAGRNVEVMAAGSGSLLITRKLRISARTMAWRFARFVRALSNSAVKWVFSRLRALPSMAASSKP
ncbi:transposase [Bradyrhizobium niftali]|uniref:transposase n=1 Tax=Bradyrhizobium niftali TaxID=2560055 RepID=UPI003D32166A